MSLLARSDGRQAPLVAVIDWTFADFDGTNFTPAIDMPADAIITRGALIVEAATNTANISIGDSVDPDSLLTATAGAATGDTALNGADVLAPVGATKRYGLTASAQLTQGSGKVTVEYVRTGRAQGTHG